MSKHAQWLAVTAFCFAVFLWMCGWMVRPDLGAAPPSYTPAELRDNSIAPDYRPQRQVEVDYGEGPASENDGRRLASIEGSVPSVTQIPPGCAFHTRCPHSEQSRCDVGDPPELETAEPGHDVACFRWQSIWEQES